MEEELKTLNIYEICRSSNDEDYQNSAEEWAKQRAEKGYCDYDIWEMGRWSILLLLNALKEYKPIADTMDPTFLKEEYLENRENYSELSGLEDMIVRDLDETKNRVRKMIEKNARARWLGILDEMIKRFEKALFIYDHPWACSYPKKEYYVMRAKACEQAFDLYKKYCFCL